MDCAFEEGAGDRCLVYLPWATFNNATPLYSRRVVTMDFLKHSDPQVYDRAIRSVYDYHPNPDALRQGGLMCMARNYLQVMGVTETPVDGVVFWAEETDDGKVSGGTAQAVSIARDMGIPTWNLQKMSKKDVAEELFKVVGVDGDVE